MADESSSSMSPQSSKVASAKRTADATEHPSSKRPTRPADLGHEAKDRYYNELYKQPPDFKELAALDKDLAPFVKGHDLDFSDAPSVMQLTKSLLHVDFDLNIELPNDRLCPPVPNRHNYIVWLKRLLDTTSYAPQQQRVGLDIGTGSSCIYPLLGCVQRPWSFVATDVDAKSLEWARKNVAANGLESRIKILERRPSDALIPLRDLEMDGFDFTMTNPPFYESEAAMAESAAKKAQPPPTVCTGSKGEMVVEGGEVAFVSRILEESLILRERVQWYTAMFGFLSSLISLVEKLREHKIDNYAVSEFVQGTKTRRWVLAWSFQAMRPSQEVARGLQTALTKNILPPPTETEVLKLGLPENIDAFAQAISNAIGALELVSWSWDKQRMEGVGRAVDKVWARAWRRKKKREMEVGIEGSHDEDQEVALGFKVSLRVAAAELGLGCRWLEGHDAVVFESFQGFLKATAKTAQSARA